MVIASLMTVCQLISQLVSLPFDTARIAQLQQALHTQRIVSCIYDTTPPPQQKNKCPADITHKTITMPHPTTGISRTRSLIHIPGYHLGLTRDLLMTVSYPSQLTHPSVTHHFWQTIVGTLHQARTTPDITSLIIEVDEITASNDNTTSPHPTLRYTITTTQYSPRDPHIPDDSSQTTRTRTVTDYMITPYRTRRLADNHTVLSPRPAVDCSHVSCVALTFDDGPSKYTDRLLDILDEHSVPATFYVLGPSVRRYPDTLQQIHSRGHEIGNHTWTHTNPVNQSAHEIFADIAQADELIYHIIGQTPATYRPPYGSHSAYTDRIIDKACMLRNVDSLDRKHRNTTSIINNIKHARPGSIIVVHDIHKTTIHAVPDIIATLRAKGYTFVTVSDLFAAHPDGIRAGVTYYSQSNIKDATAAYYASLPQ